MTDKEYREHEGISRSELFKISKSPLHFKYAKEHPAESDSPSLLFGRAVHKYLLEPETFDSEFAVAPNVNKRTKAGKEEFARFMVENPGKEVITLDDFTKIQEMAMAVRKNPVAASLLKGTHEQTFFWTDSITGEKCKCRTDCITEFEGKKYIVDYKTTDSCEDGHFERSCRKYGYKFQAGMYTEGVFQNTLDQYGFVFVAQEKSAPYAVRVYFCTPEYVNQGYDQFREYLGVYHACKESGDWYGYEGPMNTVTELLEEDN